ncbi:Pho80p cyclin [Naganishia albida]|nr:Pho80p cyclin [Naganishia albida]
MSTIKSTASTGDASAGESSPGKGKERQVDEYGNPVLPWAFIDCDTDDLVVLIAHMLNKLMEHNDQVVLTPSSLTRFHSRAPPAISVIDYLRRIVKYTNLERLPLLSLLAYIDITCNSLPTFTLSSLTVHRFLIAGVTAGSKALCDVFCTNAHYAKVGGIKVNELNALERELVKVTDWNLCVHAELLQQYYTSLIRSHGHYAQSPQPTDSPFTTFPLPEPQKGLFDDLVVGSTHVREDGRDFSGAEGKMDDGQAGGDTLMDGPEGDVDMEVDGDVTGTRIDRKTTIGHASPTSRKHQSTNAEQSSPISSDVEPSSQSASSSNASGQLARANVASPLEPGPSEEAKPSSPPTSRAESLYASPHTQVSNGSIHPSLKSTSSRKGPGLTFPIVISSGPASPRTDTTSAAAEDMVGIVSASEVQMYVGELADGGQGKGATGPNERRDRRISLERSTTFTTPYTVDGSRADAERGKRSNPSNSGRSSNLAFRDVYPFHHAPGQRDAPHQDTQRTQYNAAKRAATDGRRDGPGRRAFGGRAFPETE